MKTVTQLAVLTSLISTQAALASKNSINVAYGEDNRLEVFEAPTHQQTWAASTVTMVPVKNITPSATNPGSFDLKQDTLRTWIEAMANQEDKFKKSDELLQAAQDKITFCEGSKFTEQPNPGMCSGFLIAPDLIVTAGHCVEIGGFCENYDWVFDFKVDQTTQTAGLSVPADNIYKCKKVVSNALINLLGLDYAIVQLDRQVKGRTPLEFRNSTKPSDTQGLVVIGSPSGLPLKVAGGANIRKNSHPFYFTANLDTFQGNSGSAVFNSETGMVEGILVRGEEDYVPNQADMCIQVNYCPVDGCRGEDVSRMTSIPEVGVQKALYEAAEAGDQVKLENITKIKFWIDFYGRDGQSALIKAAAKGQANSVKFLVAKGSDANLKDAQSNTALHHLAKILNEANQETLKALISSKADLEAKNAEGETPLLVAAKSLNAKAVEILLSHGANGNATDGKGNTAADIFKQARKLTVVAKLALLGVKPSK